MLLMGGERQRAGKNSTQACFVIALVNRHVDVDQCNILYLLCKYLHTLKSSAVFFKSLNGL